MGAQGSLPRYVCHKEVRAVRIAGVTQSVAGDYVLHVDDPIRSIVVSATFIKRHDPHVGGYYVIYQDGYTSFSPAAAFLEGYSKVAGD